jgi:hypothetical protein
MHDLRPKGDGAYTYLAIDDARAEKRPEIKSRIEERIRNVPEANRPESIGEIAWRS